jgi:hypothetical protein
MMMDRSYGRVACGLVRHWCRAGGWVLYLLAPARILFNVVGLSIQAGNNGDRGRTCLCRSKRSRSAVGRPRQWATCRSRGGAVRRRCTRSRRGRGARSASARQWDRLKLLLSVVLALLFIQPRRGRDCARRTVAKVSINRRRRVSRQRERRVSGVRVLEGGRYRGRRLEEAELVELGLCQQINDGSGKESKWSTYKLLVRGSIQHSAALLRCLFAVVR